LRHSKDEITLLIEENIRQLEERHVPGEIKQLEEDK